MQPSTSARAAIDASSDVVAAGVATAFAITDCIGRMALTTTSWHLSRQALDGATLSTWLVSKRRARDERHVCGHPTIFQRSMRERYGT